MVIVLPALANTFNMTRFYHVLLFFLAPLVLLGGEHTLRRATLLIVETSFEKFYEDQPLFDAVYQRLVAWGFVFAGVLDQMASPRDGRTLQADSLFLRQGGNAGPS
jgi:hypothetical protein